MKNNLTEARFQFLAGVINENEFKQLNESEESTFLPMASGDEYLWDNIEKNIENNKEEIMNKLGINSYEEFEKLKDKYYSGLIDIDYPSDYYDFDLIDLLNDMDVLISEPSDFSGKGRFS